MKIGPVDVEIIGMTEIDKYFLNKQETQAEHKTGFGCTGPANTNGEISFQRMKEM